MALSNEEREIRRFALISLAMVEWQAGRLHDSLERLNEAAEIVELAGQSNIGRYHLGLATTLQTLATAETGSEYLAKMP